jgi:hypothetical protein
MTRRLSSWLVGLVLLVAWVGSAQAAKRRVGVTVAGPHATQVHEAIAGVLRHHGFEVTSTDLSGDSDQAVAQAARQDRLAAVVVGEVRDGGKRLKLRVHGSGGDLIGEGSWSEAGGIKKLVGVVERTLWARVGGALAKARPAQDRSDKAEKAEKAAPPPAAEEEAPAAEPEKAPSASRSKESESAHADEEGEAAAPKKKKKKKRAVSEEEEPEQPTGAAATALDLGVALRFVTRDLSWTPPVMGLRGYSLGFAPAFGAAAAWYPAAHFRGGLVSNLGVATSIEYTPGLVSQASNGAKFPTTESDYWGGVRGRLVFGDTQASLTVAGGQHSFIFHSNGAMAMRSSLADLPDVQYTYVRAGLDARIGLPAGFSLALGAGYRYVLNAGTNNYLIQANQYFPKSSFLAFDVAAGVGYRFISLLEARVGFDLRRYQMSAGTNTYMVTGATDQYIGISVGLAVLLDGYAGGEGGPAAKPAPAPKEPADKGEDKPDQDQE